jgi:hypothetical protein
MPVGGAGVWLLWIIRVYLSRVTVAAPRRRGRTVARAILGAVVYLTGVGLMIYAIPAQADTYLPGGLLAGAGAGLQGPALLELVRDRKRRRARAMVRQEVTLSSHAE